MSINIFYLFCCVISVFGITNILVQGAILNRFREFLKNKCSFLYELIKCPMCSSFWIGLLVGSLYGPFSWYNPLNGFFYSATTWILWCLVQFLGNGYDASRVVNVLFPEGLKIDHKNNNEL